MFSVFIVFKGLLLVGGIIRILSFEGEMAAVGGGVKFVVGEDLVVFFDFEGSRGLDIEFGYGRFLTRS